MKKFLPLIVLAFLAGNTFSQWTRIDKLPSSAVYTIYKKDSTLFAGGDDIVYISKDNGKNWDSTSKIPGLKPVDGLIVYKHELYVSSFGYGAYKSSNMGQSWVNIENNILPYISQFKEWRGNLYASTLGDGMSLLDSVTHDRWINFNNGLSDLSLNVYCLNGNERALIAGTLRNGIFDRYAGNSAGWDEDYIVGRVFPTEGFYEIATGHDSLFMAGFKNFYMSTDDGQSWKTIGSPLNSGTSTIIDANEALIVGRNTVTDDNNTIYYYLRKDSLDKPMVPFSEVDHVFTYRMILSANKMWAATSNGLFYMGLEGLPGISESVDNNNSDSNADSTASSRAAVVVGNIYPNPAANFCQLSVVFPKPAELTASIYDQNGKRIHVVYAHQKFNRGRFDLSFMMLNYSSGPYFLNLSVDSQVFVRKIIHINR
ncbi:MAG: hypothetical protein C5B52_13855 [Bacteroidetes bacterium]|nr:MAG: hypothetical protein C5B52_13855 [Bacteroidota bacterium]